MQPRTPTYNTVAIALHWAIAALVVVMFFFGLYADAQRDALRAGQADLGTVVALFNWHKTVGLLVLALVLARLGWRLAHKPPPLSHELTTAERALAKVSHAAFYVLLIGIPLAGWLVISTSESGSYLFNNSALPIPQIWADNESLNESLREVHKYAAYAIMGLLVVHVGAALKHHFMDKTDTITRMAPFVRPRRRRHS